MSRRKCIERTDPDDVVMYPLTIRHVDEAGHGLCASGRELLIAGRLTGIMSKTIAGMRPEKVIYLVKLTDGPGELVIKYYPRRKKK